MTEVGIQTQPVDTAPLTFHRESRARTYSRRIPIRLVSGQGVKVRDEDGNEYIDCLAGAGALALGHHHPAVTSAIRRVLDEGAPLSTLDMVTPARDSFIEELFDILPAGLRHDGRIQFCGPSGADAVEAAIKLARTATSRAGVLAFGGGYHGMTMGALAVSGGREVKEPLGSLLPDTHHLPFPTSFRSPFGLGAGDDLAGRMVSWALEDPSSGITSPAAVIAEPVQGEGGVHPMPSVFAARLRDSTRSTGTVLIADEVQTGLGRTGALWGSESIGLDPDVLVLSKAIGGGLPLAVIVYRKELDAWQPGAHAGTFRGSTLALAAGAATIREVVKSGLAEHASATGDRLIRGLTVVADRWAQVGNVRGRGLMVGAEVVDPEQLDGDGIPVPDGVRAARIQRGMLRQGVIVEVGGVGDAVIRFLPPLIITPEHVDQVVDAFAVAVATS